MGIGKCAGKKLLGTMIIGRGQAAKDIGKDPQGDMLASRTTWMVVASVKIPKHPIFSEGCPKGSTKERYLGRPVMMAVGGSGELQHQRQRRQCKGA